MSMIVLINVIDNLDSDSERDALSAYMGKVLRLMIEQEAANRQAAVEQERQERIAADNAEKSARETEDNRLWAALRQEIQDRKDAVATEKSAREAADTAERNARITANNGIWEKLRNLWFSDIHGKLSGTRVYALEGNEGP